MEFAYRGERFESVRGVDKDVFEELEDKSGLIVVTDAENLENSKLYYNGNPICGGTPTENVGEIYSTEEVRIGTWIDGKPLYRIVEQVLLSTPTSFTYIVQLTPECEVKFMCAGVSRSDGVILPVPTAQPNDLQHQISLEYQPKTLCVGIWCGDAYVDVLKNRPCWVVVEYTKTTD